MEHITKWYKKNVNYTTEETTPKRAQQIQVDEIVRRSADGDSVRRVPSEATSARASFSVTGSRKSGSGRKLKTQLSNEMLVTEMGFTQNAPIDWEKVDFPAKTELMFLLEKRIARFDDPDVLVKIGNHEFRCHMLVLQSYSGFFSDPNITRIELPEDQVSKTAFALIYDWMTYKGRGSFGVLRRDNILEILSAAEYLQVKELEGQCWALIDGESTFNEQHAFLLYLAARRANNTQVMDLMVPRVRRFFLTLVACKEFVEMSLEEVLVFLKSSYICVTGETDVFMSGVRWLTFDWEGRQRFVARVMGCVRFGLISPSNLVDIRRNKANREFLLVTGHPEVARMVDEGLAYAIVQNQHTPDTREFKRAAKDLGLDEPMGRCYAPVKAENQKRPLLYMEFLIGLNKYKEWFLTMKSIAEGVNEGAGKMKRRSVEMTPDPKELILPNTS